MKFSLIPINVGVESAEQIIGIAQLAEQQGLESVWTFEHVIVPNDYESKYPYSGDGKMATTPETNFFDPLIAIAAAAMHTKTLRFGTGVNILSQANPLYLAKQAASLDVLTNGRLMLGLGIGWLREEFDAMGVPFAKRGARYDDYITAMRKVWSGETASHQSEFLQWENFKSFPLPVNKSKLPIVIGGATGKVYQRVARLGDGWYMPSSDADDISAHIAKLKLACEQEGRAMDDIELTVMFSPKQGLDQIKRLQDLGVHRVTLFTSSLGANFVDGMAKLSEDLISKV